MMWGDVGQLYTLVSSPERPDDALFTWHCGQQARTCRIPRAGLWLGAL